MRFKRLLPILLSVTTSVFTLSGCSDFDNDWTANEIMYKESFAKTFGKIDPEQDWNLASRAGVTVTCATPTDVKIYALTNGTYKLVADYANVSGTKTLGFDVREDVTDLMVTNGSMAVKAKVGGSISFDGITRAGYYGTTGEITVTKITDENEWFVFDKAEALRYTEKLPEGGKDWDGDEIKDNNLGQVTQNFTFVSNGEFTIYPIFWQTTNTDEIGIYYTDAAGLYHEVEVYTIKSGDELEYTSTNASTSFEYCFATDAYGNDQSKVGQNCAGCTNGGVVTKVDDSGRAYHTKVTPAEWSSVTATPTSSHFDYGAQYERSKGIKVCIPAGTLFGMYIKPSNGIKQYSEQEKNAKFYNSPNKDVVAATFTLPNTQNPEEEDMYLCFEDWQLSSCDADLNDVVLRFYGATPSVIDGDPDTWVICSEDLGNTFDLDYNDVVLEVSHLSGKETAKISAIAAGGTLASYIYFGDQCLGEVHELLGQPNNISGKYSPVNVDGTVNTSIIKDQYVTVPADWSLTSSAVGDASYNATAAKAMGGISIRVVPKDTQASESAAKNSGQTIQNSTEGNEDNIPYMICVPRNFTRTVVKGSENYTLKGWFRWSNELQSLYEVDKDKYGDGTYTESGHSFAEWVADKNCAKDWYMYPNTEKTTGIYYDFSANSPSQPSDTPEDETPAQNYGTLIETSSFVSNVGAPSNFTAFKIDSNSIPADKTLKITLIQQTDTYVQLYCATASYGTEKTINGVKGTAVSEEISTSNISGDYFICLQQGSASDAKIFYSFE